MVTGEPTIGERIKRLRGALMTQADLAAAADVSVDLIRKLEQGRRHTASISSLHRIARALDVDTAELLAKSVPMPSAEPDTGVVAIRRVLTGVGDLLGETDAADEAVTLDEARRTVTYAWGAYWTGRYELLGALLPHALMQVSAVQSAVAADDAPAAAELFAELLQITGCTLVHLGQPDSAYLALRQGLDTAAAGGDELRPATLRGSLAWLLLTQGRFTESHELAVHSAGQVEPDSSPSAVQLSVWGSLLLTGATAAGRDSQVRDAAELLGAASEVADRTGDRNDYETAFGPTQVTMQTVDVHVVTDEFGDALTAARKMPRDGTLPLAARARHLADVAYAQTRVGRDENALATLLAMEQMAPDWIKYQTLPRQVVRELIDRERQRSHASRLRHLAKRLGVN